MGTCFSFLFFALWHFSNPFFLFQTFSCFSYNFSFYTKKTKPFNCTWFSSICMIFFIPRHLAHDSFTEFIISIGSVRTVSWKCFILQHYIFNPSIHFYPTHNTWIFLHKTNNHQNKLFSYITCSSRVLANTSLTFSTCKSNPKPHKTLFLNINNHLFFN